MFALLPALRCSPAHPVRERPQPVNDVLLVDDEEDEEGDDGGGDQNSNYTCAWSVHGVHVMHVSGSTHRVPLGL